MSLSALRRAHRNPVYLPGFGDADPPEPGPYCECPECRGSREIAGEPCWFCQDENGTPLGYYYDDSAEVTK